jgi:hypothetical protein
MIKEVKFGGGNLSTDLLQLLINFNPVKLHRVDLSPSPWQ